MALNCHLVLQVYVAGDIVESATVYLMAGPMVKHQMTRTRRRMRLGLKCGWSRSERIKGPIDILEACTQSTRCCVNSLVGAVQQCLHSNFKRVAIIDQVGHYGARRDRRFEFTGLCGKKRRAEARCAKYANFKRRRGRGKQNCRASTDREIRT